MLLLLACSMTTLMTAGKSQPEVAGTLPGKGLGGPVEVRRDEYGVPHIRANSEPDASFAIGFVHGQDRLWQMELERRLVAGELSEVLGADFAQLDAFMRALDVRKASERSLQAMDADTRFNLASYAAGVNAAAADAAALPVEMRLLKMTWREWTPADTLAVVHLQSWALQSNAWTEIVAFQLRDKLSRDDVDALFRLHPEDPRTDPYWDQAKRMRTGELVAPFKAFMDILGGAAKPAASNNFVIGGERTLDGRPILSNDPHLVRGVPNHWYVLDAKGGNLHVAGGTMPGIPWVISGHNDGLAWGATNLMADYVDFAVLERDGPTGYVLAGQKKQMVEAKASLKVKDEDVPREIVVQTTEIGPVVSELAGTHVLVMRWAAMELTDGSMGWLHQLNLTQTVEGALALGAPVSITGLNMVLADTTGDYAWQAVGAVPKRKAHTGRVPYPGSSEHHGWDGLVQNLPGERKPARGYVVTANNRPNPEPPKDKKAPPFAAAETISTDFIPAWRRDRIAQLIEATPKHTMESVTAILADQVDLQAKARVGPLLEGLNPQTEGAKWCYEQLMAWDYKAESASPAPLVWAETQRQLVRLALEDKIGKEGVDMVLWASTPGMTLIDVDGGLAHFSEDPQALTRSALLEAHKALLARYGELTTEWTWGDAHPLHFKHPFDSGGPTTVLSASSVDGFGGSPNTVNPGGFSWRDGNYETTWIASMRVVTPLSDVALARFVHPPGQSGVPTSPHYQDLLRFWVRNELLPLWWAEADVSSKAYQVLTLNP